MKPKNKKWGDGYSRKRRRRNRKKTGDETNVEGRKKQKCKEKK